jgi:hypothetical protein
MSLEVHFSGPMFDGRAVVQLAEMCKDVQETVAKAAEDTWQSLMDASFRHPTGAYQSHVNIARDGSDLVVNDGWPDSQLEYGPWLEGVGSRNSPVTRFPGYHALSRAAAETERNIPALTETVVDRHIEEIDRG